MNIIFDEVWYKKNNRRIDLILKKKYGLSSEEQDELDKLQEQCMTETRHLQQPIEIPPEYLYLFDKYKKI